MNFEWCPQVGRFVVGPTIHHSNILLQCPHFKQAAEIDEQYEISRRTTRAASAVTVFFHMCCLPSFWCVCVCVLVLRVHHLVCHRRRRWHPLNTTRPWRMRKSRRASRRSAKEWPQFFLVTVPIHLAIKSNHRKNQVRQKSTKQIM